MQKKTNLYFRWAAIFFLVSFAFSILSDFIYYLYYQLEGSYFSTLSLMEYLGGASLLVTKGIRLCLLSGFLVLGLFLQKRWAVVTGLILQLLPLLYSTYSKLQVYFNNIDSFGSSFFEILHYLIFPLADLLLLGGFYALLLVRLFRKKPFHPTLASITLLLPIANFLIFCAAACYINYIIPPVAFLQNLLPVLPLLFMGAGFFPPRRQSTPSKRTLSLCGFWSLVIGLAFGICICVVSIAIYDEIYVYYGYEYTKWMWWAVNALMFFGAVTAPGLLRYWRKANATVDATRYTPQPVMPPMPPMPQFTPQSYAPYPPAQPVQYAPPAQPVQYAPPAQPVQYAPPAQPVQYAPPAQPVQRPVAPVMPPVTPVVPVAPPVTPVAPVAPPDDVTDQLRRLRKLQDEGLISQEDYDAKKKQLLGL